MHLSFAQRLGLLLLATLPVAWGNCPGWFDGRGACGDTASAGDAASRPACPCCAKKSREGRPLRGCEDCPIVAVRRTASPVPPTVVLPPPALLGLAPALPAVVHEPVVGPGAVLEDPSPPAGPPDLVGIVLLLV